METSVQSSPHKEYRIYIITIIIYKVCVGVVKEEEETEIYKRGTYIPSWT